MLQLNRKGKPQELDKIDNPKEWNFTGKPIKQVLKDRLGSSYAQRLQARQAVKENKFKTLKVAAKNPNGIAKRGRPPKNKIIEKKTEIESDSSDEEDLQADEKINQMEIDFTKEQLSEKNQDEIQS